MIDKDIAEITRYYKETKEGQEAMCKAMEDRIEKENIRIRVLDIKTIMEKLTYSAEQAMEFLNIPCSEYPKYKSML